MSALGVKYVPAEGPDTVDIMFVGEAPGREEETNARPFVGKAGKRLQNTIEGCGLRRSEVYLTNLCKFRPKGNKFLNCLDTPQLKAGLRELQEDIERLNPNVICALGAWPLYFLTGKSSGKPGTGITSWRGSILESTLSPGRKVIPTLHPSYVERTPVARGLGPTAQLFQFDVKRAIGDKEFPDLRTPVYESFIDPPDEILLALVNELHNAEWISIDIETFGTKLACIGFCCDPSWGLCLTYEGATSWSVAEALLASRPKKLFQFGTFDVTWLKRFMGWSTHNYAYDTYIASASLLPEFPRGLDFLTSIYTRMPYYKVERKIWKESGDLRTLWEYNVKDIVATYLIAREQMGDLVEEFNWKGKVAA